MMPNAAWAAIIVGLLAVTTAAVWRFWPRVVPIVFCHNLMWAGTLALIGTGLVDFADSPAASWLTLIAGILAFDAGVVVAAIWPRVATSNDAPAAQASAREHALQLVSRPVFFVLAALYLIGFAVYVGATIARFGLETFLFHPGAVRGSDGSSYLETVPVFARALLYIGPLLFVLLCFKHAVDKPFPWYVRILGLLFLAASMLALLQRTNLFVAVLWAAAVFVTSRIGAGRAERPAAQSWSQRLRWSFSNGVVAPVVVGGLVLLVAFQVVGASLNKGAQQAISTGAVSPVLIDSNLASPFMYATGGTVAFLQLAESEDRSWPDPNAPLVDGYRVGANNPQTWGGATFEPLVALVPGVRSWEPIAPFIDVGRGVITNVFTWLEPLYRDFRVLGVAVGMLVLGWGTGALFLRRFGSAPLLYVQAALFSTIFLAGFASKYNTTIFIAGVGLVLLLWLIDTTRRRVRRQPAGEAVAVDARVRAEGTAE